jgi:uncharacterized protein (DUF4415 family)
MSRKQIEHPPLLDEPVPDEDNPEWTVEDFARAKPVDELPPDVRDLVLKAFPKTKLRGPQKASSKIPVSIRLSPEVVEHFKAGGPGWQSRINEALKKIAKG